MNCDVTLTASEFKVLHNALCDLEFARARNTPELDSYIEQIRSALEPAYKQESVAFERKWKHYDAVRDEIGAQAVWSIYEVEDLNRYHPYASDVFIQVGDKHWPVEGLRWKDMYIAADKAIRSTGDTDHIFIERFVPIESKGSQVLRLYTGS